jgi:hypothetical protein
MVGEGVGETRAGVGVGVKAGGGGAGVGVLVAGAGVGVKVRVGTVWRSGLWLGAAQIAGRKARAVIKMPIKIQRAFSFIFAS